jgi:hypothetical protein
VVKKAGHDPWQRWAKKTSCVHTILFFRRLETESRRRNGEGRQEGDREGGNQPRGEVGTKTGTDAGGCLDSGKEGQR